MILIKLLSYLPLSWLYFLAHSLAFFLFRLKGYRRDVVRQNLKNSFPEKTAQERIQIEKAFNYRFLEVFAELIKSYSFTKADWERRCKLVNPELLAEELSKRKPVILMAGHVANWEWPAQAISLSYEQPIEFLYKPVKNQFFDRVLYRLRSKNGGVPIKKDLAFRDIMKKRNVPRMISFIGDQTPSRGTKKQWFSFLHQETPFYEGAEKIAKMLHYSVYYEETVRLRPGYYEVKLHKLAEPPYDDEPKIIERYVQLLEQSIRNDPAAYLWFHKRWKYSREEEEKYLVSLRKS